jgi:type IV secretory pathway VirB4 component
MGETGCGKTSLIRFLCKNVLREKLRVFNIHAGITTKMITDNMEKYKVIAN